MDPAELRRELERLAAEAREQRARLGELGARISTTCARVATIRSTLLGASESTPGSADAQDRVEAHAG
jgi:cell division septum initiation protein DivIVA